MGDFNQGHIQWKSLESTGGEDEQFLFLIQDSFLTQHVLEPSFRAMWDCCYERKSNSRAN